MVRLTGRSPTNGRMCTPWMITGTPASFAASLPTTPALLWCVWTTSGLRPVRTLTIRRVALKSWTMLMFQTRSLI